jgi:hypothetical protein
MKYESGRESFIYNYGKVSGISDCVLEAKSPFAALCVVV